MLTKGLNFKENGALKNPYFDNGTIYLIKLCYF